MRKLYVKNHAKLSAGELVCAAALRRIRDFFIMDIIIELIRGGGTLTFPNAFYGFVWCFAQCAGLLFILIYLHQFIYLIVGTFVRYKEKHIAKENHTIGVVISARNESAVIGNLIKSVRASNYPQDKIKIFVIADNCTDNTADVCRSLGCIVFERHDETNIGKGYALHFLFEKLHTDPQYADIVPEAYIVLDADNLIKPDFISEMNRSFDSGYQMVTSYRNTKNFGANWISAGYGYWFLHEARHLSNCRRMFHLSCAISGTGFLISAQAVKEFDNWKFFTLTEDIECSTNFALAGKKVGYNSDAELYDEQPVKFSQSWRQRERWSKGFYQVFGKNGGKLIKGCFKSYSCYDILTTIFPALFFTLSVLVVLPVCAIVAACIGDMQTAARAGLSLAESLSGMLMLMIVICALTAATEWKKIKAPAYKKILYIFTFPIFMATYIPISVVAIFKKVEWKPINHTAAISLDELESGKGQLRTVSRPSRPTQHGKGMISYNKRGTEKRAERGKKVNRVAVR